jgi:excisionase family DNA binding protein
VVDEPLLLRVADAARLLSLSRSAVYELIAAGQLPHIRLGSSIRLPRAALERSLQDQTIEPTDTDRSLSVPIPIRPNVPARPPSAQPRHRETAAREHPGSEERLVPARIETQPRRVFVDDKIAAQLEADAETMTVLRRLEDAQIAHFGVGPVRATPVHERGICWNVRTAYEESTAVFGGPGALQFDTWYPDIAAVSDPDLVSSLRADDPWFLVVDGSGLELEIADWRAEFLKEGTSPFPDRLAKRQAIRRSERRRPRRDRQDAG